MDRCKGCENCTCEQTERSGYKNHEGYADPTASIAERRAEKSMRKRKRSKGYPDSGYRLNELYCFRLAERLIKRAQ